MDALKNLSTKFKNLFDGKDKNKISKFVLILGLIGIALIFLSEVLPEGRKNQEIKQAEDGVYLSYEREEQLERRLEEMLSKIEGAGKTSVMLTLDSSKEFYYAAEISSGSYETETERRNDTEANFAIIDGENGEEPLIIKVNEAKIRGVLVVCEGGDNATVTEKIIDAVCAVLGVPSSQVSVSKMA